jgi:hypothetical protein
MYFHIIRDAARANDAAAIRRILQIDAVGDTIAAAIEALCENPPEVDVSESL